MNLSSWNPTNTKSLAVDGWIVKRTGTAGVPLRRAIAGLEIRRGTVSRVLKGREEGGCKERCVEDPTNIPHKMPHAHHTTDTCGALIGSPGH